MFPLQKETLSDDKTVVIEANIWNPVSQSKQLLHAPTCLVLGEQVSQILSQRA